MTRQHGKLLLLIKMKKFLVVYNVVFISSTNVLRSRGPDIQLEEKRKEI